jgi:hypothetical protein
VVRARWQQEAAGPTFTYRVSSPDGTLFDIQFGAAGKLIGAVEHVDDPHGGPSD